MSPDMVLGCLIVATAVLGGVVSAHAPQKSKQKVLYAIAFVVFGIASIIFTVTAVRESATQSAQIVALTQTGINTMTGGDSFCHMRIFTDASGLRSPSVFHHGKYPLYDVVARIADTSKYQRAASEHKPMPNPFSDLVITIGNLAAGLTWYNRAISFPFSESQFQSFNIFFSARNGLWTEEIRLSKVDGAWATALRVTGFQTNTSMGNQLYEEVDKTFPRQPDGTIDWTQYLPAQ